MDNFKSVSSFYTFPQFMQLMVELVAQEKTTGNQPEIFVYYTRLNLQRLQRWDKTLQLNSDVTNAMRDVKPQIWWVINEAWCGDAAQTLPVMEKMCAAANGNIDLRIILRDEHLDIMDRYLTNGGRSIPIVVATDKNGTELFHWGPRPAAAQKMMMDWKAGNNSKTFEEIEKELHLWYTKDKGLSVQRELLQLMDAQPH